MEMEKTRNIGNSGKLHRLIRNSGQHKPSESEMIKEFEAELIQYEDGVDGMARLAEHLIEPLS